jgi:hypothetical protein
MVFSSGSTPLTRTGGSFAVPDQLETIDKGKDRAAVACWPNTQYQSLESRRNRVTLSIFNDSWKDLMAARPARYGVSPRDLFCVPATVVTFGVVVTFRVVTPGVVALKIVTFSVVVTFEVG